MTRNEFINSSYSKGDFSLEDDNYVLKNAPSGSLLTIYLKDNDTGLKVIKNDVIKNSTSYVYNMVQGYEW